MSAQSVARSVKDPETCHAALTTVLQDLAMLFGCASALRNGLPDGRRPDVLAVSANRDILFVGDAKDTETPGSASTYARFDRYLEWARAYLRRSRGTVIVAICFREESHAEDWQATLNDLCIDASLPITRLRYDYLAAGVNLVWTVAHL